MTTLRPDLMREATRLAQAGPRIEATAVLPDAPEATAGPGEFTGGTHTQAAQSLRYKLFVPQGHGLRPLPLVVMLHGCTQDADDFAAGTGMNERARERAFFVLYPQQASHANPAACWNWFKHNHQQRGRGEPALIASLTKAVMQQYGVDPRRVYLAGLSAGGAMAAIVAAAYPELFAAVGVHSGLPGGAASNLAEALAVMQGGANLQFKAALSGNAAEVAVHPRKRVPTIVFHGDQDRTVHPRNGEQVIAAALEQSAGTLRGPTRPCADQRQVERGVSAQGRHYTRQIHNDDTGRATAEHWLVHGAGHAWSGGQPQGSCTEADGPDATREMLRFFFAQAHPACH